MGNQQHKVAIGKIANKIIFGIIMTAIVIINNLLTGCEQPEIQEQESLPVNSKKYPGVLNKDSIDSWDTDTTVYHSQSVPNTWFKYLCVPGTNTF